MISFRNSKMLSSNDLSLFKDVAKYTLNKFVANSVQNKLRISVLFKKKVKNCWSGECVYLGVEDNFRKFDLEIVVDTKDKRYNNPVKQNEITIKTLIHELVHVSQYANNQLFDYTDGKTKFEGKIYQTKFNEREYWNSPWEVLAYGWQECVYEEYCIKNKIT